jgi:NAD(P)-dependent dehydrogenase (short-subunit alcohol dehydrogenase family)
VRDRAAVLDAFSRIHGREGRLDIVVSNAGIARHGRLTELDTDDLDLVVATNLYGFLHVLTASIPLLRHEGGAIVAVSSVHALATAPQVSVYAATKAAIVGVVRAAALDHAPDGIRVNAVLPGSVATPMLLASAQRRYPDDPELALRQWAASHPIGRVLSADEVAHAIVFLASPQASGITGVALPVDGGLLAKLAL